MSLYRFLGRLVYQLIRPLFRFLPRTHRMRCLLIHEGQVLLVKNWLGRGNWTLPGGGVHSRETAEQAAARELREELALQLGVRDITFLGEWNETVDGMKCRFDLCVVQLPWRDVQANHRELVACEWFRMSKLPLQRAAVVDEALRRRTAQP